MRKTTILFIIIDLCAIICFVLFYGPFEKFRNIIVNTAMVTKSHQYIAYTFYIENTGNDVSDYWTEIIIDDVVKNVDEAVRIRVYKNGEAKTYAKIGANGNPERDTIPFKTSNLVVADHVENFKPGDIDKYTIVMWIEGSDPECTDNILGGEIKAHMEFNSEFKQVMDDNKE